MYSISQLRRQFEALKRKYARVIAAAVLKPVADQIVNLWDIATAKKQPKPNPLLCIQKVVRPASASTPSPPSTHTLKTAATTAASPTPWKSSTSSSRPKNPSNCPPSSPAASPSGSHWSARRYKPGRNGTQTEYLSQTVGHSRETRHPRNSGTPTAQSGRQSSANAEYPFPPPELQLCLMSITV